MVLILVIIADVGGEGRIFITTTTRKTACNAAEGSGVAGVKACATERDVLQYLLSLIFVV